MPISFRAPLLLLLLCLASGTASAAVEPLCPVPPEPPRDESPFATPALSLDPLRLEGPRPHWRKNLFKRVLTDQKFLVTTWAPTEMRRPRFFLPVLAGFAGAADSASTDPGLDLRLSGSFADWGQNEGRGAATAFSRLGDGPTAMVLLGGTYFVARWSGKTRLARASSLSSEALLNTAIWSTLLKRTTRRARPSAPVGTAGQFFVSEPGIESSSFPSGHAMGAFAVAGVFAAEYRDRRWVRWVAYGTASLIATSRVALGRHYFSDILVGAMIGHSLGRMVAAREYGMEGGQVIDRFQPIFEPERRRYGLQYSHSW